MVITATERCVLSAVIVELKPNNDVTVVPSGGKSRQFRREMADHTRINGVFTEDFRGCDAASRACYLGNDVNNVSVITYLRHKGPLVTVHVWGCGKFSNIIR